MLWYVMHEGMLRHVIGDAEIMGEQFGKLIKAAETPRIIIQVLPFTAHKRAGTEGPIWIYERIRGPTVAYAECYGGGRLIEGQDEVAATVPSSAFPPPTGSASPRRSKA
jgi:Domain of unknown function (DUF5753)